MKLHRNDEEEERAAAAAPDALLDTPLFEANTASTNNQLLADVFSSSPPPTPTPTNSGDLRPPSAPPSDLPRLRAQHFNAGYLDGIALSKSTHVQRGFDHGYPLGASLGLRIGYIFGVLASLREFQLLKAATEELDLTKVLGDATDGWEKWLGAEGKEGDLAGRSHPVVERWTETVERAAMEAGIDLRVLDREKDKVDGKVDGKDDNIAR